MRWISWVHTHTKGNENAMVDLHGEVTKRRITIPRSMKAHVLDLLAINVKEKNIQD
jgi:hypothetical protein